MRSRFIFWLVSIANAGLWILVVYLTLPRLFKINFQTSLILSVGISLIVLVFNVLLGNMNRQEGSLSGEQRFALGIRYALSLVFAIVGAFGMTVAIFLTQINRFLPGLRANYVQKFIHGFNGSETIFYAFILIAISLFALDALPHLISTLQRNTLALDQEKWRVENEQLKSQLLSKQLVEVDEKLKESYQRQILMMESIEHELKNQLSAGDGMFKELVYSLKELDAHKAVFDLQATTMERLPGQPREDIDTHEQLIKRIEHKLGDSQDTVRSIRDLVSADQMRYTPSKMQFGAFVKSQMDEYKKEFEDVDIEVSGSNPSVEVDAKQFKIVLANLMNNAWRHALKDFESGKKMIGIDISEEGSSIQLAFSNTGHELPDSFNSEDFLARGKKAGAHGNSGLGGYLIGMIIHNHGGSVLIGPAAHLPFVTTCTITLPKTS